MKYNLKDFQKYIPSLSWPAGELADKLSAIGFEAEAAGDSAVDVTLTSNRKDCQELRYLAFDLAGIYNLETVPELITFELGPTVDVMADDVNKLLGTDIGLAEMQMLERLGFEVSSSRIKAPAFRNITTIADVAEEVVRLIGFDKLAIKPLSKQKAPSSADFTHLQNIKAALAAVGLSETATSSFSAHGHIKLKNPFAQDEPFLRESLLDGLLKTLGRNPFLKRAAFFEVGNVFEPDETEVLGIVIAGYKNTDELIKSINHALGEAMEFDTVDLTKCQKFDAKQGRVIWTQIPLIILDPIRQPSPSFKAPLAKFQPISKFPPLVRDITINKTAQKLVESFKWQTNNLLIAELVDEYQDNQTHRLIFQKMAASFDEAEIHQIDNQINKHFFRAQSGVK